MDLAAPKPKKTKLTKTLPLPIRLNKCGHLKLIEGIFNGFAIIIENPDDMKSLTSMGYFGKANFSRNYPQFAKLNIIRERQLKNRKKLPKCKPEKVIVVPDSDSDDENYFTNLYPKYDIDHSGIKETVCLGLEEAFFLTHVVKCLVVHYQGEKVNVETLWTLFQKTNPHFIRNYIVYFYYRAKNWVVKPGIKFGGDFMLYKEGPPFYHASYVVIIEVIDASGNRDQVSTNKPMDNTDILGLNRLCETAGKELLLCQVKLPMSSEISYEDLTNIEIKETLIRRWIASQEREDTQ